MWNRSWKVVSHVDTENTKIVKHKLTINRVKSQQICQSIRTLFFRFIGGPLDAFLEAIWGCKKPLGDVWDVFWRPWGSVLGVFGGSLGRLGGILGAWPPKMPSRIPEGGPKSCLRWSREAPRRSKRARKGSQETPQKAQEATQTTPRPHLSKN